MASNIEHVFSFSQKITIGKIIWHEAVDPTEKYWYYLVKEDTHPTISHTTMYNSRNYLTIKSHRDKLINKYQEAEKKLTKSTFWQGIVIEPSLLDKIREKFSNKTR